MNNLAYQEIVDFIRANFNEQESIPLLSPRVGVKEKEYVLDALENGNIASQGKYIQKFEKSICKLTKAKHAILVSSGTNGLFIALKVAGVRNNDEVLTQSLSFVATANAISYCGAEPNFVDVDADTLGLSPLKLKEYLFKVAEVKDGVCYNKRTNKRIAACMPMHTFGNPLRIQEILKVCDEFNIKVIEDAAQALGSYYNRQHVGTFGCLGVFSFNGNKIVSSGGGGAIITDDVDLAHKIRFLTNQAKEEHPWEYDHSAIGYNLKMPNLNAALGFAQLEQLEDFIEVKTKLKEKYQQFFKRFEAIEFLLPLQETKSNEWLQTILFLNQKDRVNFLKFTHEKGVYTRPVWKPLHQLVMYKDCQRDLLEVTEFVAKRLVNLPS